MLNEIRNMLNSQKIEIFKRKLINKHNKYKNFILFNLKVSWGWNIVKRLLKLILQPLLTIINVVVNGLALNFVLWAIWGLKFTLITVAGYGILIFLAYKIIDELYDRLMRGISLIKRR